MARRIEQRSTNVFFDNAANMTNKEILPESSPSLSGIGREGVAAASSETRTSGDESEGGDGRRGKQNFEEKLPTVIKLMTSALSSTPRYSCSGDEL